MTADAPGLLLDSIPIQGDGGESIIVLKDSPAAKVVTPHLPAHVYETVRRIPAES